MVATDPVSIMLESQNCKLMNMLIVAWDSECRWTVSVSHREFRLTFL